MSPQGVRSAHAVATRPADGLSQCRRRGLCGPAGCGTVLARTADGPAPMVTVLWAPLGGHAALVVYRPIAVSINETRPRNACHDITVLRCASGGALPTVRACGASTGGSPSSPQSQRSAWPSRVSASPHTIRMPCRPAWRGA